MPGLSSSYPLYASVADLTAYLGGTEPADALALLQRASGAIRGWTSTAVYNVNSFDQPIGETADAFHDAAILQAAAFVRAGIAPGDIVATQTPAIQSKSLGGRSVTYATDSSAAQARVALLNGALVPEAVAVLARAGLLGSGVNTGGRLKPRPWVPIQVYNVDGGEG